MSKLIVASALVNAAGFYTAVGGGLAAVGLAVCGKKDGAKTAGKVAAGGVAGMAVGFISTVIAVKREIKKAEAQMNAQAEAN